MLPNPLKTQNLNRKNEATCWNCPLKLFQNSAIRDPLSCDYKKDSQWSTFARQLSKPPPSVDVSSSIGNSNWEKFLIHCVFMNIPFPPSGSNMFSVKNFPKNILRNCLHSLVAGTTRRLSLLLFSYRDDTLQNRSHKAILFKNLNWWAHLGKRCFASSLSTWLTSLFRGINADFQCLPAIADDWLLKSHQPCHIFQKQNLFPDGPSFG